MGDENADDDEDEADGCGGVAGHGAGPALGEGNARNGNPRRTVAIPIAFPICEAT